MFSIIIIKEAEPHMLLKNGDHPASYKHVGFHSNVEQDLQSKRSSPTPGLETYTPLFDVMYVKPNIYT